MTMLISKLADKARERRKDDEKGSNYL